MKDAGKSLGQFLASVLESIHTATYIPAGLLVGGVALISKFHIADMSEGPIRVLADSPAPTFAELAVFIVVVGLVAALVDPVQFFAVRLLEGHISVPLVSPLLRRNQLSKFHLLDFNREAAAANEPARRRVLHRLGEPIYRGPRDRWDTKLRVGARELVRRIVPEEFRASVRRLLMTSGHSRADFEAERELLRISHELKSWPIDERRIVGTRIGNLVRSYEDRANSALAKSPLPASVERGHAIQDLLPFAYFAIPERTASQHEHFRSQFLTSCSMLFIVPPLGVGFYATLEGDWRIGAAAVFGLAELAAYLGARNAADGYGTMLLAIARQYASGEFRRTDSEQTPLLLTESVSA